MEPPRGPKGLALGQDSKWSASAVISAVQQQDYSASVWLRRRDKLEHSQQKCIVIFALLCCFAVLVALIFSAVDLWGEDEDGINQDNCNRDCRVVLVENIPDDVSLGNGSTSHLPLAEGLSGLVDGAVRVVEIVSPIWILNSSEYESSFQPGARQGRLLLSKLLALKSRKVQLKISSETTDSAELETLARHGAQVRYVNTTALTKGHLRSSFWVVDRRHVYIGSGTMDWRSLATRKELGVLVYNCSCLALDLHRVFNVYWGLQYKDFVPSFWSKRLFALFNQDSPLELTLNGARAQAYVSTSPDVFIPKDRSTDLEAIGRVIGDARRFVYISVTDYLPLLDAGATRYWSRIDGFIREALILRGVRVRLLIACREDTRPLTFNFVQSLRSLCLEQTDCSLETKFFDGRVQKDGSLREVNNNKFVVTERDLYLGNLDWVGNEFTYNAGIGLVVSQPGDVRRENTSTLVEQLRATFERDWFSSYARSPQAGKFDICGKRRTNRAGPAEGGRVDGKGQDDGGRGKENGQEINGPERNLTHLDSWSPAQINDSKEPDGPSPESTEILNEPL
ncbi:inactive phospholipase D5-like [Stigmatopora argus]